MFCFHRFSKSPLNILSYYLFFFWRFVYSCPAAFIKYLRSDYYHHFHIELRALNAFILSYLHQYSDCISSQSHAPLSSSLSPRVLMF